MDRLKAMEVFVSVARHGSFARAARMLGLSTTAVSRHVQQLEDHLGARLLNRTTRRLGLTEAGAAFLERGTGLLAEIDALEESVTALQAVPAGVLRVSAPVAFGHRHLVPALPDFLDRWPRVEVDAVFSDRFVDLVEEGFDLAVRIGALDDSRLVARRLAPARLAVVAAPAYLARRGVPRTPADLAGHDCIVDRNLRTGTRWPLRGDPRERTEVHGRLRLNGADAAREAALAGGGLALLPTFIAGADLAAGRLCTVLEDVLEEESAIHAVYPHARHLSPKVRAFVEHLRARFGDPPYWDTPPGVSGGEGAERH